jgi:putative nucleotidyltransferase with HDIG domain
LEWYAVALALASLVLLTFVAEERGVPTKGYALIGLLAVLAALAERQPVRVGANFEMTVSVLPVLFAAVVFGPFAAMVIAGLGLLVEFRRPYLRWLIWTSLRMLGAGLAGLAASQVLVDGYSFERLVGAAAIATTTEALVDVSLGALTVTIRRSGASGEFIRSIRPILLATISLYTPVIVLLAYAYELSPWSLVLFLGPAFAAHRLYGLYRQEREATQQLARAYTRLEEANLSFASALVAALDARDRYTAGHSAAVAVYARDIARRMGLSDEDQQLAHLAGLLHDIGKVGLPAGILEKAGPLTLLERRQMEEHSVIGERILAKVIDYGEVARIVRHHHERIDGNGYPDGLLGPDIPVISKIIGVADAYNAMTSGRPYRDAMPSRVARMRLAQAVETQFDTSVVAAFEAILASSPDSYLSGIHADFAIEAQKHGALTANASDHETLTPDPATTSAAA